MVRKMMLGIKHRAETVARAGTAAEKTRPAPVPAASAEAGFSPGMEPSDRLGNWS
jgi:hypothetical protein